MATNDRIDADLRKKRREREAVDLCSELASEAMKSPKVKRILLAVLGNMLREWAGKSFAKKKISIQAIKLLSDIFNPESLSRPNIDGRSIGKLLTLCGQQVNERYIENPLYLTDSVEGILRDVIKNTDFGELKEVLDRSEDPVVELVKRLMGFVWNTYPAKLGAIMSFVHPLGNMAVRSIKEIVLPLNGVTPDLFADLIFSIIGSIDGKQTGELLNALMEMVRQLHTGSLLQGESGVPQFQMDYTRKFREIMSGINPELLCKVKVIAAENAEERANAKADVLTEHPGLVLDMTSRFSSIKNPKIRATKKKIGVYEAMPQDEFADAVVKGTSELDTQEMGEIVNSCLRVINNIHEKNPNFLSKLISGAVMNIDQHELKTAADWVVMAIVDGVRPIAGDIMPSLISGLKELSQE